MAGEPEEKLEGIDGVVYTYTVVEPPYFFIAGAGFFVLNQLLPAVFLYNVP
jgi:hypothetical protein